MYMGIWVYVYMGICVWVYGYYMGIIWVLYGYGYQNTSLIPTQFKVYFHTITTNITVAELIQIIKKKTHTYT